MIECECGEVIETIADWQTHFERCNVIAMLSIQLWDKYVDYATLDAQLRCN